MNAAIIKSAMKAIKDNNMARIKALAQAARMRPGQLVAAVKKKRKKKVKK